MTVTLSRQDLRRAAAADLTTLLENHKAFSFVRLGDGEVKWLREMQAGNVGTGYRYAEPDTLSVEVVSAVNGMESRHFGRFLSALEQASYLDRCDNIPRVRQFLSEFNLSRAPELFANASPETSNIIFEWTGYELRDYLTRHNCLFAGAEAALLRELATDKDYQKIATDILPFTGKYRFHQIRENGRLYSENLDLIKDDLRREISEHDIDTVFLSLGSGAKIVASELATETGVRVVDFGSMARALTYAGSPGYQSTRDMHNPFLFRVPIRIFMPALQRAHPELTYAEITAKALAQIMLELHHHERFAFNTSDGIDGGGTDLSDKNLFHFQESLAYYQAHLRAPALADPQARKIDAEFYRWCLKKGLGWRGRTFRRLVRIKSAGRIPAQFLGVETGPHPLTPGRFLHLTREKFSHGLNVAWYRDVVRPRISSVKSFGETYDDKHEIHVLTSQNDWTNLLWALHSFYRASQRKYALCIHDDGTLEPAAMGRLQTAFPNARLISRGESDRRAADLLKSFPRCSDLRATNLLSLKIFDFVAYLQAERMMLLDSDILFFDRPEALLDAIERPNFERNTLNRDWRYGYSIDIENTAFDFILPPLINSGLGLIHRGSIRYDWIEEFLALPGILSHPHRIEQTLFALCSARYGFEMLPAEYDVHVGPMNPGIPCRHYTGPIRHLMYGEGMRRLVRDGILRELASA